MALEKEDLAIIAQMVATATAEAMKPIAESMKNLSAAPKYSADEIELIERHRAEVAQTQEEDEEFDKDGAWERAAKSLGWK